MLIYMIVGAFAIHESIQASLTWPPICYEFDGTTSTDFACDPNAAVSACCSPGWVCASNLYCELLAGVRRVGTCTQDGWSDHACPFPLNLGKGAANTFNYTLNTTKCDDGTICPFPRNDTCCEHAQGIVEIKYNDVNLLPTSGPDLATYYTGAGYTVPSSALPSAVIDRTVVVTTTGATMTVLPSTELPQKMTSGGSGLSSGAKAGIGVGVPIGAIIFASLLSFLIRRMLKGRQKTQRYKAGPSTPIAAQWTSELPAEPASVEKGHDVAEGNESKVHCVHELPAG